MSRVIAVYILISLIFLLPGGVLRGQSKYVENGISKAELKEIKKQVRKMKLDEKLGLFTLTAVPPAGFPGAMGIVLNSSEKITLITTSSTKYSAVNLSAIKEINGLPFPSVAARKQANLPPPKSLLANFKADFFVDLDPQKDISVWGLDSSGVHLTVTGYKSTSDYLSALLNHDLVYLSDTQWSEDFIKNLNISKDEETLLNSKVKTRLLVDQTSISSGSVELASNKELKQWIKLVYLKSKEFEKISSTRLLNSLDYAFISLDSLKFLPFTEMITNFQNRSVLYSSTSSYPRAINLYILPAGALTQTELETLATIAAKTPVWLLSFGLDCPQADSIKNVTELIIPDENELSQTLVAQKLFDVYNEDGQVHRLGYGMPEDLGFNLDHLQLVDSIVYEAIHEEAIPGCQLLIAKDGLIIWEKAYGYQTYDSLTAVTQGTIYDLASLTKPLATTQAIMYLIEQNKIDLDQPLSTYLPYLKGSNKENITASQVLSHQAGLYPYFPFWKKAINELSIKKNPGTVEVGNRLQVEPLVADSIRSWAIHSDLLADRVDTITHEQYMYSDIGFYFLKDLVEQDTKMPMDRFLYQQFYFSLPTGLRFNPRQFFPIEAISPTEEDALLRNELVQGFVHDRNAALLGGVAGQAGLFGNAYDVAVMMQMQLNNGKFGGRAYFDEETVVEFTSRHFKNNRRGLGWDMPGPEPDGPISVLASDESFGHTGFTGCAVWADPKENLIFVFLSNRVYPSVENNKLIENNIRTRIQDVVYESLNKE